MNDETTGYSEGSETTTAPLVRYDCCGNVIDRPEWLPGWLGYERSSGDAGAWCYCSPDPNEGPERLHCAYGLNDVTFVWCDRPACEKMARSAMCEAGR